MVQEYVDKNLQNFFSQFKGKLRCQKQLKGRQKEKVATAEIFSWILISKTYIYNLIQLLVCVNIELNEIRHTLPASKNSISTKIPMQRLIFSLLFCHIFIAIFHKYILS